MIPFSVVSFDQMTYFGCEANKSVEVCISLTGELEGRQVAVALFTDDESEVIDG